MYARAEYNLTLSHSRLRSPTFHPQRRQMKTYANECFPSHSKIEQPIGKGRVRGRGREGVHKRYFMEHGRPDAGFDFYPNS